MAIFKRFGSNYKWYLIINDLDWHLIINDLQIRYTSIASNLHRPIGDADNQHIAIEVVIAGLRAKSERALQAYRRAIVKSNDCQQSPLCREGH